MQIHIQSSKWGLEVWITIENNADTENEMQFRLCPLVLLFRLRHKMILHTNFVYSRQNPERH